MDTALVTTLSTPATTPAVTGVLLLAGVLLASCVGAAVLAGPQRRVVPAVATLLMVLGTVSAGVLLTSPTTTESATSVVSTR
ncbi:MAG: hypothetical protein LWW86_16035 [Micrococcales bacterium]|nr:hypothetical protein [Micrococcales bacterium]